MENNDLSSGFDGSTMSSRSNLRFLQVNRRVSHSGSAVQRLKRSQPVWWPAELWVRPGNSNKQPLATLYATLVSVRLIFFKPQMASGISINRQLIEKLQKSVLSTQVYQIDSSSIHVYLYFQCVARYFLPGCSWKLGLFQYETVTWETNAFTISRCADR